MSSNPKPQWQPTYPRSIPQLRDALGEAIEEDCETLECVGENGLRVHWDGRDVRITLEEWVDL